MRHLIQIELQKIKYSLLESVFSAMTSRILKYAFVVVLMLWCGDMANCKDKEGGNTEDSEWSHKLYVKTNALGLSLLMANGSVEADICKHLSFNLPVYYSSWNYFKPTVKFRTFFIQPEIRCWIDGSNDGFFLGPHFSMASFNIALGGEYRYQDHEGVAPAMGGGLSLGYRFVLDKKSKWKLEFSLGGGYYKLHYDRFINTENVLEGAYVDTVDGTYIGLDSVNLSICYMFDLKSRRR